MRFNGLLSPKQNFIEHIVIEHPKVLNIVNIYYLL